MHILFWLHDYTEHEEKYELAQPRHQLVDLLNYYILASINTKQDPSHADE